MACIRWTFKYTFKYTGRYTLAALAASFLLLQAGQGLDAKDRSNQPIYKSGRQDEREPPRKEGVINARNPH